MSKETILEWYDKMGASYESNPLTYDAFYTGDVINDAERDAVVDMSLASPSYNLDTESPDWPGMVSDGVVCTSDNYIHAFNLSEVAESGVYRGDNSLSL